MADFVDLARRTELFAGLDDGELQTIAASVEPITLRDGQIIFREGDAPDRLYVIESGRVRIAKGRGDRPGTYARFLATLEPGEIIGEMALVLDVPRSATAIAEGECVLHGLARATFDDLITRRDRVAFDVLRNVAAMACRRLERTCEGLVDLRLRVVAAGAATATAGVESLQSGIFHRTTA